MTKENQIEKQRMATLLHSPELGKEYLPQLKESDWTLTGNQWLSNKCNEHLAVHRNVPTFNILLDYATSRPASAVTGMDVAAAHAEQLLTEYQKQSPQDLEHFKTKMFEEVRQTRINNAICAYADTKDLQTLKQTLADCERTNASASQRIDLASISVKPATDQQNLLNEWAFERQAIIALVGGTGYGKSTLNIQLAAHLAIGKATVGFVPHRPLKVLIIQNEDSDADLAYMRDGATQHFTDDERQTAFSNIALYTLRGKSGKEFLAELRSLCAVERPDVVFVNPLLKYFGGDPNNHKEVSAFLNELEPLLQRHNCGMVFVHHTVKQSKLSRHNQSDTAYSGFGSAAWSNAVRDTIELRPSNLDGFFTLQNGKRASRWGWKQRYIRRSENPQLPFWHDVSESEVETITRAGKAASDSKETILSFIEPLPTVKTIKELEIDSGMSERTIRTQVAALLKEGRIAEGDNSDGNRFKRYYRTDNSNN